MTSVENMGRLDILKDKGPGFDFIILHVLFAGEPMEVTINFPDGKKRVYLWIDEFKAEHLNKSMKFDFIGHISASEKIRGHYNARARKGWIEYYDGEAEKQAAAERDIQILALGSEINHIKVSGYLRSTNIRNEFNMSVISASGGAAEKRGFEFFGLIIKRLQDLNIQFDLVARKDRGERTRADTIVLRMLTPMKLES